MEIERKEIQKTDLQIPRYISRYQKISRREKHRLAGDDVILKMQFALQKILPIDRNISLTITH